MSVRSWADYTTKLLLGGAWLPVTDCVLFINAPADRCVDELMNGVRGVHVLEHYGYPMQQRDVRAHSLPGYLETLLPLDGAEARKYLFLQTENPEWTAMFTSDWRGQDPSSPMAWFAQGRIATVSIEDAPHTPGLPGYQASFGIRKIQMYEIPERGEPIGHTLGVRAVNTKAWEVAGGLNEFPVGNVWSPDAKRVTDRFTHEDLVEMASRFGLHPYNEAFYAPGGQGILVERTDPTPPDWPIISLAQARGEAPTNF